MLGKITRKTEKEMSPPYLLSKATPWQYALLTTGCADPKGNFVFPYDEGMLMSTMAVLVDGGFYLKRARNLKGAKTPRARAKELVDYCRAHVKHEGAELYRIFYYDCDPIAKKVYHPLHNRTFDQSKTDDYAWKMEFFAELANKRKLAIRKGQPLEGSGAFVLKSDVSKCIVRGERDVESLTDDDFVLDVQQKGVDVRIGLDVALISLNRYADQIVLITGDSEKWILNNDIFPGQSPTLESGSCISTHHYYPPFPLAIRTPSGFFMVYGKFRGHEGIPEIHSDPTSLAISDRQIWRLLKSHAAHLEVSPFLRFSV